MSLKIDLSLNILSAGSTSDEYLKWRNALEFLLVKEGAPGIMPRRSTRKAAAKEIVASKQSDDESEEADASKLAIFEVLLKIRIEPSLYQLYEDQTPHEKIRFCSTVGITTD